MTRSMICHYGMSDKLGMVNYGETDEPMFLGRDMGRTRDYSEATAQEIDREVKQFCDTAYEKARDIISTNVDKARRHRQGIAGVRDPERRARKRDLIELGRMLNPPENRVCLRPRRCRRRRSCPKRPGFRKAE